MKGRKMHWTAALIIGMLVGALGTVLIVHHYVKDMWR